MTPYLKNLAFEMHSSNVVKELGIHLNQNEQNIIANKYCVNTKPKLKKYFFVDIHKLVSAFRQKVFSGAKGRKKHILS